MKIPAQTNFDNRGNISRRMLFRLACVILLLIGIRALIVSPAKNRENAKHRQEEEELSRRQEFARNYGGTWPDLFNDADYLSALALDVQKRLVRSTPVGFEMSFPNVRSDGQHLILYGSVANSMLDLKMELTTNETVLKVVRNNPGLLWVVAKIDSVEPHDELQSDGEGKDYENTVYHVKGTAIAVSPPQDPEDWAPM
jgi:hypothetical protein